MTFHVFYSVSEVAELRTEDIEAAPDTGSRDASRFINGLYNREEGLLILVDASRLLSDDEMAELATI